MEGLCADFGMKPGGAISQAQFIAVLKTELRAAAAAAAADGGGSGDGAFVAADSLRANGAATAGASGAGAAVTAATERQVLTSRQASAFSGPSMSPFAAAAAASIGGEAAAALPPASSVVSSTAEGGALMPGPVSYPHPTLPSHRRGVTPWCTASVNQDAKRLAAIFLVPPLLRSSP